MHAHGHHHHGHGVPKMGGPRARRGDVPAAVLSLLREQDMHGYQMIQEISDRTDGAWTPSPGSIYPALQMLEEQDMVESSKEGGKRVFALTDIGRTHANMLPDEGPWADFVDESDPDQRLRESFLGLMQATKQIGSVGSESQVERTIEILGDARKSIYKMLAEGE